MAQHNQANRVKSNTRFRAYYFKLSGQQAYEFRNKIIEELDISERVFYSWTAGRTPIKMGNQLAISGLFGLDRTTLFSEL